MGAITMIGEAISKKFEHIILAVYQHIAMDTMGAAATRCRTCGDEQSLDQFMLGRRRLVNCYSCRMRKKIAPDAEASSSAPAPAPDGDKVRAMKLQLQELMALVTAHEGALSTIEELRCELDIQRVETDKMRDEVHSRDIEISNHRSSASELISEIESLKDTVLKQSRRAIPIPVLRDRVPVALYHGKKDRCPVCQENMLGNQRAGYGIRCGHAVHYDCLILHTSNSSRCPLCRVELVV